MVTPYKTVHFRKIAPLKYSSPKTSIDCVRRRRRGRTRGKTPVQSSSSVTLVSNSGKSTSHSKYAAFLRTPSSASCACKSSVVQVPTIMDSQIDTSDDLSSCTCSSDSSKSESLLFPSQVTTDCFSDSLRVLHNQIKCNKVVSNESCQDGNSEEASTCSTKCGAASATTGCSCQKKQIKNLNVEELRKMIKQTREAIGQESEEFTEVQWNYDGDMLTSKSQHPSQPKFIGTEITVKEHDGNMDDDNASLSESVTVSYDYRYAACNRKTIHSETEQEMSCSLTKLKTKKSATNSFRQTSLDQFLQTKKKLNDVKLLIRTATRKPVVLPANKTKNLRRCPIYKKIPGL